MRLHPWNSHLMKLLNNLQMLDKCDIFAQPVSLEQVSCNLLITLITSQTSMSLFSTEYFYLQKYVNICNIYSSIIVALLVITLSNELIFYKHKMSFTFLTNQVPGYDKKIDKPMDFSTMRQKVSDFVYNDLDDFEKDFNLIIDNCLKFNSKHTMYYKAAVKLRKQVGRFKKNFI